MEGIREEGLGKREREVRKSREEEGATKGGRYVMSIAKHDDVKGTHRITLSLSFC